MIITACVVSGCAPERPSEQQLSSESQREQRPTEADSRPVVQVNGETITVAEFERRLSAMAPYARTRYGSVEKRQELLDSVVTFELLADEAERRGLGDDPTVRYALKDAMVRQMLAQELYRQLSPDDITEGEVQRAYRERLGEYQRPEQRRAAIIEVDDEALIRELAQKVDDPSLPDAKARIQAFRTLSSRYSLDQNVARQGGDVGFLPPPDQAEDRIEIARRVFELEQVGQMSPPFRQRDRWFLVMYLDKKPANTQPVESVAAELRQQLYEQRRHQKRQELIETLKKDARIEVDQAALDAIPAPESTITLDDLKLGKNKVKDLPIEAGPGEAP